MKEKTRKTLNVTLLLIYIKFVLEVKSIINKYIIYLNK